MEKELRINLTSTFDSKGIDSAKRSFSELERESLRTISSQRGFSSATSDAARSVDDLSDRIGFMGHAYVGFQTIMATSSFMSDLARDGIKMADTWNLLEGRLRLVTDSSTQLASVQADLFDIAQESRTGYEQNADLYARIARATQDLNKTQYENLDVTEAISKSFIVSGAASESAKAAVIQLGQGFASGTLRGEELNSVLEQAPRLAEAIADGMGVSVGKLKDMGAEGKLTAEKVYEAIRTQKDAIEKEFDQMPKTVSQSLVVLTNQIGLTIHEFDQMHGVTAGIAEAISGITVVLSEHSGEIGDYIGYVGGAVVAILAWKARTIALNGIQAAHAAYVAASTVATTSYSIATNTTTTAVTTLTARQVTANAAVGAWNKLIAINPYAIAGAAIVGVGLVLKDQADQLRDSVRRTAVDVENLSAKALQAKITYGTMQLDAVNRSIEDPSFMKSVFGNERIDLHRKVQLENELKAYGKQLQKLHEEASKPSSNNSGGDKQDPLSDKELKKIEALKEKQKSVAEQLAKLNHDLNDEIFKATASEHEKAMKLIDDGVAKFREGGANKIKIAQLVSIKQEEYLEAEYAKAMGQFDALDKETDEKTKSRLAISEDMYTKLNELSGNWYDNELLNTSKWVNDYIEKGGDIEKANEYLNASILKLDQKRYDEQTELVKKTFEEQNAGLLSFLDDFEKAMDNQIFDVMVGKWNNFGDWFKDFWSSLSTSVMRAVSSQLSTSLTDSIKNSIMGSTSSSSGIQNIFKTFGGFSSVSSLGYGSTLSADQVAQLGGTFGQVTTTSGGTIIDQTGKVIEAGNDLSSLSNIASIGSLLSTSTMAANGLGNLAALTGSTWLADASAVAAGADTSALLAAGGSSSAAMFGSMAAYAGPIAAAAIAGYYGHKAIDRWTGSDTYQFSGMALGHWGDLSTKEKIIATILPFTPGLIGKTKATGSGLYFGEDTSTGTDAQSYIDYKKKSWISSKKWTAYGDITDTQQTQIESAFKAYDYLLEQLGSSLKVSIEAGKYTSEAFSDALSKSFMQGFLGADVNSSIYSYWSEYAKSIDSTVQSALTSSLGTYISSTRSFSEWKLGSGTSDQLKFTADYLSKDLTALENMMGVSGVTVDNFLTMYDEAIKNSFTPETIDQWNSLGEALMKATDANKSYTDSLKALTASQAKPIDMMISKVTDAGNTMSTYTNQLLVQVVKELKSIKTNNLFQTQGAI